MKRRVIVWTAAGFLIACCFVVYTFVVSPGQRIALMSNPLVQLFTFVSSPVTYFHLPAFPIPFWWVPVINAATYGALGVIIELLRRKSHPCFAV